MEEKKLNELSNEELLVLKKKAKPTKIINASIIGFCLGIAAYSVFVAGITWPTIFPLILAILAYKYFGKNEKAVDAELKARNLK
ncbi:hypothetical protein [Sphingobacterium multivorum]|jgi:CHASE2 domain-containing sensor protein|uniref:hypothetical protein n=1 Tax=Sphingobacterium multivorum TaxID=28454 RepID=UPI0028980613|nr:hypothetical protein [Sphingobacterium multivorum]